MSLPELIQQQALIAPERIAVCRGAASLTFKALSEQVQEFANLLHEQGCTPGTTVALCMERSPSWVIAALATMRLGAAYVPIDPAWPDRRIVHVVQDSSTTVLITPSAMFARLALPITHVDPESYSRGGTALSTSPPAISPDALAYVIYTSGSTGTPKGVEITHANLMNLVQWNCRAFSITSDDVGSHLAGLGFDAAGWEIWPYLCAGACVDIIEDEAVRQSPRLLQTWMCKRGITVGFVPTALASEMIAMEWPHSTRLRTMLTGADTLQRAPKAGLPFVLVNNYGPTECTVVATSGLVQPESDVPPSIGRPIDGCSLYVLDDRKGLCEPGSLGELYIGGAGVGRGYRNLPELTVDRFLPDPFSEEPGARMYRTGDFGMRLPDGQIKFRGRVDRQVKVRGLRVELDEISALLSGHPAVGFATVEASTEAGEAALTAYVLPAKGVAVTTVELREFLAESLPRPMIPSTFVRLTQVPLSSSGKLDRSALPLATAETLLAGTRGKGPGSDLEAGLLTMVRELLRSDEVWVDDDFFLIGGHSLLGTQLVLRLRQAFEIELTLRHLFEAPTVELLAMKVEVMLISALQELTEEEAAERLESEYG